MDLYEKIAAWSQPVTHALGGAALMSAVGAGTQYYRHRNDSPEVRRDAALGGAGWGALGGALGGAYVGDVRSTRGTGLPGRAFDRDLADRKKALHEGLTLLREGPDALKPPVKPQVAGLPVLQAEALRLQHREMQEALGKVEREIAEAYADLHRKIAPHMTPEEFEHALRTTDIDAFLKGRRSTRLDPPDTLDDLVSGSGLWKTNRQR